LAKAFGIDGCRVYTAKKLTEEVIYGQRLNKAYLIEIIVKDPETLPVPVAQPVCFENCKGDGSVLSTLTVCD